MKPPLFFSGGTCAGDDLEYNHRDYTEKTALPEDGMRLRGYI